MNFEFSNTELQEIGKSVVSGLLGSFVLKDLVREAVGEEQVGKKRLTQEELAAVFGVKSATIGDWIAAGKIIRYYPVTAKIKLFDLSEVYQDIDRYNGTDRQPWYSKSA